MSSLILGTVSANTALRATCSSGGNKKAHLRSATDNQVEQYREEKADRRRFAKSPWSLLSLRHGRIVDQELFDKELLRWEFSNRIPCVYVYTCCISKSMASGTLKGGTSTKGRLSVVMQSLSNSVLESENNFLDSDRVQGELRQSRQSAESQQPASAASKSTQRAEKRRSSQDSTNRQSHENCGNCSPLGGRIA